MIIYEEEDNKFIVATWLILITKIIDIGFELAPSRISGTAIPSAAIFI